MAVPHQVEHAAEALKIAYVCGKLVADTARVFDFKIGKVQLRTGSGYQADAGSAGSKADRQPLADSPASAGNYNVQSLYGIWIRCHVCNQIQMPFGVYLSSDEVACEVW